VWIRTAGPCPERGDVRLLIAARAAQDWTHAQHTDVPVGPDSFFTPAWDGYRYEAIGWIRRYRRGGWDVDLTGDGLPGRPPMLRLFEPGTEHLKLEAALWWQRAYRPTADGGEPPLVAELHWRPGEQGPRQSLLVALPGNVAPTVEAFKAARVARARLLALQPRLNRGGRRKGWRGGRPLGGQKLVEWYQAGKDYYADERRTPSLSDLAQVLHVRSHHTAKRRWEEETGLPWPPPPTFLDDPDE
jgi:hypothetical protein